MMVGRDLGDLENLHGTEAERGAKVLKVEQFTRDGHFKDLSFDLHYGEILTFFGLVGSGRTEMARALIGMDVATAGTVELKGQISAVVSSF